MSRNTIIYDAQDATEEEKLLDTTDYFFAPTVMFDTCMAAYDIPYDIRIKGQPKDDIGKEKGLVIFLRCGNLYLNLGQIRHKSVPAKLSAYVTMENRVLNSDVHVLADVQAAQHLMSYILHGYMNEPPIVFGLVKDKVNRYLMCVDPHMPCLEKLYRALKTRKQAICSGHGEPDENQPGQ